MGLVSFMPCRLHSFGRKFGTHSGRVFGEQQEKGEGKVLHNSLVVNIFFVFHRHWLVSGLGGGSCNYMDR